MLAKQTVNHKGETAKKYKKTDGHNKFGVISEVSLFRVQSKPASLR